jgi:hypothetical protein
MPLLSFGCKMQGIRAAFARFDATISASRDQMKIAISTLNAQKK